MVRLGAWMGAAVLVGVLAFFGGLLAHDRIAPLVPFALAQTAVETVPAWVTAYATSFCAADATAVASKLDDSFGVSEDDVRQVFGNRKWACDTIRYVGTSHGEKGTAYVFVMHDPKTNLENWWVFTVKGGKVVGVD